VVGVVEGFGVSPNLNAENGEEAPLAAGVVV